MMQQMGDNTLPAYHTLTGYSRIIKISILIVIALMLANVGLEFARIEVLQSAYAIYFENPELKAPKHPVRAVLPGWIRDGITYTYDIHFILSVVLLFVLNSWIKWAYRNQQALKLRGIERIESSSEADLLMPHRLMQSVWHTTKHEGAIGVEVKGMTWLHIWLVALTLLHVAEHIILRKISNDYWSPNPSVAIENAYILIGFTVFLTLVWLATYSVVSRVTTVQEKMAATPEYLRQINIEAMVKR